MVEEAKEVSPAALLAAKRWEGTTEKQRKAHGRMMAQERWPKKKRRKKKNAKKK